MRVARAFLVALMSTTFLLVVSADVLAQAQRGQSRAQPSLARSKVSAPGRWATSNAPYWKVGTIDNRLTDACQRLQFNQRHHDRLFIGYTGERGKGVTGIATKEWNLRDPLGLAKPGFTYHFFNDGFSDCRVYVAKSPARGTAPRRR
jgi:hypothetical protein